MQKTDFFEKLKEIVTEKICHKSYLLKENDMEKYDNLRFLKWYRE